MKKHAVSKQQEKPITKYELLDEVKKLFSEFKTSNDVKRLDFIRKKTWGIATALPIDKRLTAARERFLTKDIEEVDQYIQEVRNGNSSKFSKLIAIKHLRPILVFVRTSDLPIKKRGKKPAAI